MHMNERDGKRNVPSIDRARNTERATLAGGGPFQQPAGRLYNEQMCYAGTK